MQLHSQTNAGGSRNRCADHRAEDGVEVGGSQLDHIYISLISILAYIPPSPTHPSCLLLEATMKLICLLDSWTSEAWSGMELFSASLLPFLPPQLSGNWRPTDRTSERLPERVDASQASKWRWRRHGAERDLTNRKSVEKSHTGGLLESDGL